MTEVPSNEPTAAESAFESETAHIAPEISNTPEGVTPAASPQIVEQGWTPQTVADQFTGILALLEVVRGPHWKTEAEQRMQLGMAWFPIFQKHVPYGTGAPSWLGDAVMWLGAIGALKTVCGPALKEELRLLREARKKQQQPTADQSSQESMRMETSEASSSSPESAGAANLSSSSKNSNASSYVD
jgi:hypothetical protein